jgi:hypothetical protein
MYGRTGRTKLSRKPSSRPDTRTTAEKIADVQHAIGNMEAVLAADLRDNYHNGIELRSRILAGLCRQLDDLQALQAARFDGDWPDEDFSDA